MEQLQGDCHLRERDRSLGVGKEGSVDFTGARGSAPPHLGCPTAPIMFRAARATADGGRTGGEPPGLSNHEGSPFPTPEEYLDCYSHRDPRTQCSGWPS